ncbi:hypothetical protein F4680DRAFT_439678 [Xylaria scruposa]|nr:hypothetical protein F4680DRAFT_439678 [Xylaria scruposa]
MAEILSLIAFPIAAYQTVEKFYEFGKFTHELIRTYQNAPDEIKKVQDFMEEMYEGELKRNMERTQWVFDQEDVPKLTKTKFSESLKVLKEQLQVIQDTLDSCFDKYGSLNQARYTIFRKRKIKTALRLLEDWWLSFWGELQNLVTARALPDPLHLGNRFALPDHRCKGVSDLLRFGLAEVREGNQVQQVSVLVEQVQKLKNDGLPEGSFVSQDERKEAFDDAREIATDLARTLQFSAKGILRCRGYRTSPAIELVFQVPNGYDAAHTLRQLLIEGRSGRNKDILAPWDYRFRLSRELVIAVYSTNAAKYVHKNLRPDNIVVFSKTKMQDTKSQTSDSASSRNDEFPFNNLGSAYIMGWRRLRKLVAVTSYTVDDEWTNNFYRHPKRQGLHPQDRYETKHDIYSLGVCLLELGLWQSFIVKTDGVQTLSEYFLSAANEYAGYSIDTKRMNQLCESGDLMNVFKAIAMKRLPMHMGTPFAELVVKCLTNVDGGFGDPDTFSGDNAAMNFQELIINDSPIDGLDAGLV